MTALARNLMRLLPLSSRDHFYCDTCAIIEQFPEKGWFSTNIFSSNGGRPICVQVLLPQGFPGGGYKLPFKPAALSPRTLYDNGSAQRRGIDYTVSEGTIVVNFQPASKGSLSVWYTTEDAFAMIFP
jgi:hypothetical protein